MDFGKLLARRNAEECSVPGRAELRISMAPLAERFGARVEVEGEASLAFHDFVIRRYRPPQRKRFLVFFQCCVRRPFYSSSSHGTIRRAISAATGYDAYEDFGRCPVHVGGSTPRTYWQRFWIQLYLEIVSWLDPDRQDRADGRLRRMKVEYR